MPRHAEACPTASDTRTASPAPHDERAHLDKTGAARGMKQCMHRCAGRLWVACIHVPQSRHREEEGRRGEERRRQGETKAAAVAAAAVAEEMVVAMALEATEMAAEVVKAPVMVAV